MKAEPEIVAETREELVGLLAEAAEIEHGLMCCYLYAAFSLRTSDDGGLDAERRAAVRRWRGTVLDVAIEEMLHLGLVANLMSAIGARPNFSRQNFPVAPGVHPAGVVVELRRFDEATLDHFVFLERPEGTDLPDGTGFASTRTYERRMDPGALLPTAQDFLTVGHLYRSVSAGFERLAAKLGERALFCGAPEAQMGPGVSGFGAMIRVADLAGAKRAIEAIVEQGEGAPGHAENGHYAKFLSVRDEFRALREADPTFDPAWPAAHNPVLRMPPTPEGRVHVTEAEPRRLLDVANSAYGLMLRCLMAAFGQPDADETDQAAFYGAAIDLMHAVAPLAERLARLPATDAGAPTAGMTFTLPRSVTPLASVPLALRFAVERAGDLAAACRAHAAQASALAEAAPGFERIRAALDARRAARDSTNPAPAVAAIMSAEFPMPSGATGVEVANGASVTLRFDAKRCIHSRHCVLEAPDVFKANTPGEWIFPDRMDAARLVAIAEKCPSGAITYARRDEIAGEPAPPVNVARLRENGPYAVNAALELDGARELRATLCRCGASKNKPYCDGSHSSIGFSASGEPATRPSEALRSRGGPLRVTPMRDGPLSFEGPLEICSGTGRTIDHVTATRLCRCGGSANKPFCDGTHAKIGFRSDA
ncbi:MAG: CDGSH iron-sulfur domain-containing protein [Hyphomicrobiales bacterium]|nr:CDGSH iron-sulfur domain-containing protein [Hyphomicrobiales bacterium]MDE2016293.1 CDGSH iron-sulfur domain-containing protein [Hyphomicrobiales bacterium]